MAEGSSQALNPANLNLTPEEKRVFFQLFQAADTDKIGVVTGEIAVKFFERTKLPPPTLGEIWQIADTENRGLLTPSGFGIVLRLIGHAQAGRHPTPELALEPAPLPRFEGFTPPAPQPVVQPPGSPQPGSAPIRVPPLTADKVQEYSGLFEKSGAQNGVLSGETAKMIFERARLPNETLGRIWYLSDTQLRGHLDTTEFIIAMHLIASYKSGAMRGIPQTLPPGLYEAASRRGAPTRSLTGSRPTSSDVPPVPAIPKQFTGSPIRTQSPLARQQFGSPVSAQSTGGDWLITPQDKTQFDHIFNGLDVGRRGFINGEQAVAFFSNSRLPEETLATIWDLADINSEGMLGKDEFAVAMYLIRQQRVKPQSVLPSALPPNLIPPSMRRQPVPPPKPTAPAFDNAANITKPKSAADDLFGLDALSTPVQIPQQSTGDSSAALRPSTSSTSTASPPPQPPSSTFKPFVPSSSFGQSLAPTFTGGSRSMPAQPADDLLGDNDPEESKKLTQDTTELANLSNQVGTLSKQMQEVQTKRSTNEQDLSHTAQQKREFELRLSQLRALYEKEVKDVKEQDERLAVAKNEVKKLQQEIALLEGGLQDLQSHHQQSSSALEAEQKENANLKERIRLRNADINLLKPRLDKLKSDLRQQKGLVAINKKQLATLDSEHEKLKGEQEGAARDLEELSRSQPEPPSVSPAPVISPAASTTSQNTNPFFRRTTSGPSEQVTSPSLASRALSPEHQNAFDKFFGPAPTSTSTPPPTSFRSETPTQARDVAPPSTQSSEGPGVPTPTVSPAPPSLTDSPRVVEPPPPPQSRQINSSHLPLQEPLERSDSFSSSVQVAAPASRFGGMDHSRAETPATSTPRNLSEDGDVVKPEEVNESQSQSQVSAPSYFQDDSITSPSLNNIATEKGVVEAFGQPSAQPEIPGAFPDDMTPREEMPPVRSAVAAGKQPETLDTGLADPFSIPRDQSRSPVAVKEDFDSAFNDLKPAKTGLNDFDLPAPNGATPNKEFPDIHEFGGEESSDSESERGFDDNFTTASPPRKQEEITHPHPTVNQGAAASLEPPRPFLPSNVSNTSTLPGADAVSSPPTYKESFPEGGPTDFPPEFKGLLPSREDPTSPPPAGGSHLPAEASAHPVFEPGQPVKTSTPPHLAERIAPTEEQKPENGIDEFNDDAFANLAAARESDDDEDLTSPQHNGTQEFDHFFDSPAASRTPPAPFGNTASTPQSFPFRPSTPPDTFARATSKTTDFDDFESNFGNATQASPSVAKSTQPVSNNDSDWDAIFAGLDSKPKTAAPLAHDFPSPPTTSTKDEDVISPASAPTPAAAPALAPAPTIPVRPQPGRALSMGTEHDDPILKRLTGMGYPREESLAALEKFDYNIDKAADFLTSKS